MLVSTFTPDEVLQIMGPTGAITGPQFFSEGSVDQQIPVATTAGTGSLSSTLTVPDYNGTFTVQHVTVTVNITDSNDVNLAAVLIAPNGTQVPLFANVGGQGFPNTTFDDAAETPITQASAPFTGTYQPIGLLSNLIGLDASGTWTLQISNSSRSTSGVLATWSLNITPQITVAPLNENMTTKTATQFQVGFPLQQLSGTYTIQLGTGLEDAFGDQLDTNQNAGVAVLRDTGQNSPTTTVQYIAADLPKAIPAPTISGAGQVSSSIVVPDNFIVQGDTTTSGVSGLRVQLNLTYPNDPDLSATLYYNMGESDQVAVPLFNGVGSGTRTANFTNTVFDDNAGTPIANGLRHSLPPSIRKSRSLTSRAWTPRGSGRWLSPTRPRAAGASVRSTVGR